MMRIELIQKRNPPSPPSLHHHTPHLLRPSDSQNQTPNKDRRPSDLTVVGLMAVSGTNAVDYPLDDMNNSTRCCRRGGSNQDPPVGDGEEEVDAEKKPTVATNRRLGYSYGAETSGGSGSFSLSPSSHQGHWCEEDKLFPLKKRRASFTCKLRASTASDEEQKKGIRETPRNTEKSSVEYDYESENEEEQEDDAVEKYEAKKAECGEGGKTPVANSNLLCRRNSGNGWRCNRPTVLGHSLCEYHLSSARMRNRNYVRTRNPPKNKINKFKKVFTGLYLEEEEDFNDKGFEKRGVMKARSISSLLSQTVPKYTNTRNVEI
ncbi:hypothetical protein RHGRI_006231 [Rhododendron griersonianum]|uniref:WRC domain-containing protein n=1 Tax=Rhododendron griersonianum TaxID=479676 RepID=A0AAV6KU11_9ERIC|nr:hypothetical protein RHGRI_006231 [Rhododendron griersonianum]